MSVLDFPIEKYEGAGNDFIIVDEWSHEVVPERDKAMVAKKLCERSGPAGADGVLFWSRSEKADGRMRVFNADGSEAEISGNGIRCVANYAYEKGEIGKTTAKIETLKGIIEASIILGSGNEVEKVRVLFDTPKFSAKDIPMRGDPNSEVIDESFFVDERTGSLRLTALSVGNPHVVCFVDDLGKVNVELLGRTLESHPAFPRRTNVNFVQVSGRDKFLIKTFERGVGITLSCGSGIAASTIAGALTGRLNQNTEITVLTDGGELWSEVFRDEAGIAAYVIGPARKVFSGRTIIEIVDGEISYLDGIAIRDGVFYGDTWMLGGEK